MSSDDGTYGDTGELVGDGGLLEAMACGCPILISSAASLPEVGGPEFDQGDPQSTGAAIYFDPFSEADIGDAIVRFFALSAEARSRLRRNALARAGEFSWERVAGSVGGEMAGLG